MTLFGIIARGLLCAALCTACEDAALLPSALAPDDAMRPQTEEWVDAGSSCPPGQIQCDGCIDAIPATAEALQVRVFSRSCALSDACHTGSAAQEGLSLASLDTVFSSAVGKPSKQVPALALIEPGQPDRSYLIKKLRNTEIARQASTGERSTAMPPPPSPSLCEAKIAAVEAWIRAGAQR